jgi:tetratricopeptide (TPR) repeat protein
MSKHKEEEHNIDIGQVYTKSEQFVENNKKTIMAVVAVFVLVVGGWFAYGAYISGEEELAQDNIWKSQYYFEVDSLDKALQGDGQYFGFEYIAENYKGTRSASLANYYMGLIYKEKGDLEIAVDYLKSASIKDPILGAVALGAVGDCYVDLGDYDAAINYFNKAINHSSNSFTAPIYLNKAALAYEFTGDFPRASDYYEQIIKDYSNSSEAAQVKKNLARVEQLSN